MALQSPLRAFHLKALPGLFVLCCLPFAWGQGFPGGGVAILSGNSLGTIIPASGNPSDIVMDETRGRLYLVQSGANQIFIYNYVEKRFEGRIDVGTFPSSAAISMDNRFLYVTNVQSSSVSVINLDGDRVVQTLSLPARPEGIEVGFDGRVLITTQGSGANNTLNTLLIFDPSQEAIQQLSVVPSPPALSTPNPLPAVFAGRPATAFPGRLIRTPDGQFIIGMVAINQTTNSALTTLFVYEAASGTVLRNRTVTGQSTVLSIAPDGSKFMAGSTLYETATLNVLAQQSTANLPFLIVAQGNNPAISLQRNFGGSIFSTDGQVVYSAFNVGGNNATDRPEAEALFVSNSKNLGVRMGIRLPETVLGKMVATADGADIYAVSESGILHIPIGKLFEAPILQPETNQVFLAIDNCNKGIARASVKVSNIGGGRATFTVPVVNNALVTEVTSGLAPSTVNFVMEPGRTAVRRLAGTNLFTGVGGGNGAAINVTLSSREAVNFPNTIRVYMNFRDPDQRGVIYPVPTGLSNNEGLHEVHLDEARGRLYISNSGFNRVEVFDTRRLRFLEAIEVGQLPRSMAMSLDRSTLFVGNSGGESVSIVDLDARREVGRIDFPPIPRVGNQAAVRPLALGMSLAGLQIVMSNGGLWKVVGTTATPRPASGIISPNSNTTVLPAPAQYSLAQTPGGEFLVALAGNGNAYLYDALADNYTTARTINTNPIQSYYGPAAGAPNGAFFTVNGLVLSPALSIIGGVERPGTTQFTPPAQPGQPPGQTTVSAGSRHIAAVAPVSETHFVRMTIPVRQNINSVTRDDPRAVIEMVDVRNGAETVVAVAPDSPQSIAFGTQRISVPARQMVVDSKGVAYAIGVSGLSVIPLQQGGAPSRPQILSGSRGIVNANTGSTNFTPGAFITVNGSNLADTAVSEQIPLPTVMGGSCLTFSDVPLPLLQTSGGQITAQIPDNLRPGIYVAQVRSLAAATQSDPVVITVQRPQ
jgi:YVTN family beta-propeller protein